MLFIYLFNYLFIYFFIHLFTYLFIYLFIYLFQIGVGEGGERTLWLGGLRETEAIQHMC